MRTLQIANPLTKASIVGIVCGVFIPKFIHDSDQRLDEAIEVGKDDKNGSRLYPLNF